MPMTVALNQIGGYTCVPDVKPRMPMHESFDSTTSNGSLGQVRSL